MANPQLQLNVVKVCLARPDRAGHDLAPAGTRVWLDVPTGILSNFTFQEFVVNAGHTLDAAGANAGKVVSIDSSITYWCLWVAPGGNLTLPVKFDADNLNVVPGFGRPLLAVLNANKELVLPNTRKVILREFNLSGLGDTKEMKLNRSRAKTFYQELHIQLDFQAQPKPTGQDDLFMREDSGLHLHEAKHFSTPAKAPVVELPLLKAPWQAATDLDKTVLLVWVKAILNTSVDGKSHHPHRLFPDFNIVSDVIVNNSPTYSYIFMGANSSMAKASGLAGQGPEVLAHELGHVLWADAGAGREFYNDTKPILTNPASRTKYQNLINDLFIKDLGFDIRPDQVAALLEAKDHHHLANNLMNAFPGNTGKVPNGLTFIQTGLFRLAPELVWP